MGYPIRRITAEEVDEALSLVMEVFMEFEAPDYGPEGVKTFQNMVEDADFVRRCREGRRPLYAAFDGDKIIAVMGMRENEAHINLVFTKKEYHHRGIATALFEFLKKDILTANPNVGEITLNASPYGKGFYLHLGFVPLSEEREDNGIRYTPMKYSIDHAANLASSK